MLCAYITVEAKQFIRHAQYNLKGCVYRVSTLVDNLQHSQAQEELHGLPEGFASFDKEVGQFAQNESMMASSSSHVRASFSLYGAAVCHTVVHSGVLAEAWPEVQWPQVRQD